MAIKYVGETALNKLCSLIKSTISTLEAAIPTKTSDITNDSDYTTTAHVDELNTAMDERVTALEQGGGGGGTSSLYVNVEIGEQFDPSVVTGDGVADKTYTEVVNAYNNGQRVIFRLKTSVGYAGVTKTIEIPLNDVDNAVDGQITMGDTFFCIGSYDDEIQGSNFSIRLACVYVGNDADELAVTVEGHLLAPMAELDNYVNKSTINVKENSGTVSSLAKSTYKSVTSVSLAAGTWIIRGTLNFASNTSGYRAGYIGTVASSSGWQGASGFQIAPTSGGGTFAQTTAIVAPTATTTYYLVAYHTSTSSLSTTGWMAAVRLK